MFEFDVKSLFNQYDIDYRESGDNVSRGWANLRTCPFCRDDAYHCGVNLSSLGFHCWVCSEHGGIYKLLQKMEIFQDLNINKVLDDFKKDSFSTQNSIPQSVKKRLLCEWPEGTLNELPLPHRNYLQFRNFDPDFLVKKYKLKAVYNIGDPRFRFRIIAPVFLNGKMVSFVGASVIREKTVVKYLNCPTEESVISIRDCLYNYDTIKDIAVIVEGITDVWRMGDGFVATLGKGMNSERISLLLKKKPDKVIIMYDADANKEARKIANNLCGLFPLVEVFELDEGDPADLSFSKAQEIRDLIHFRWQGSLERPR